MVECLYEHLCNRRTSCSCCPSNGGQALENIIGHVAKRRGYRVDKTVAEILDRYGRNHKEYVNLPLLRDVSKVCNILIV